MRSFSRDQLMLVILLTVLIVGLSLARFLLWY
jgi:hypothetical protein